MRFRRRKITGLDGWEVSAAGVIYHNRRVVSITDAIAGLPTVDLGHDYYGPVPAPGRDSTLRLLDELVAFQFHGEPPFGWPAARVRHKNGDVQDCSAGNLIWEADEEFLEWRDFKFHKRLLTPDHLPNRVVISPVGRRSNRPMLLKQPIYVGSASVPGNLPTTLQRIGA
ncbi:hypothetical protein MFM001_24580 [Mycobacterium sp. MFM001]|uniref:hypothetical protein n=1 Tax=Mycobacterium sp. MFM001 TaxID=2049453 RepID=UPI000DA48737|nr:hypothetical protein [Mycobacterium sp. MFM001]GBE65996.1 hypothetical protein MFM001_24580 [Mycobacterium sp. MFM001]